MLFYVDVKNNVVLHPDAVKLCPELAVLSEKEVVFVVLAYDYFSPYKQHPERERERQAMWHVFSDNVPGLTEKHSIKRAKELYKSLQYNPKIELINTFHRKIERLSALLEVDDSSSGIQKTTAAIDNLRSMIQKYEIEVSSDIQNKGVIKGGATLSWLEECQRNMKAYASMLQSKPAKSEA